jgi:TRAP-type C4-dicarboxylate transport system permease small subunit
MEQTVSVPVKPGQRNIFLRILDKSSYWSSLWFERVAIIGILGIILSTLIDVIGAKLFHKPLPAATEIVYFLQIIAIAGTLAFAQIDGRHVRLEFVDSLPKRFRGILTFLADILGLALFVILMYESFVYAGTLNSAHEVTAASRVPLYPFAIWIGLCAIPMCLVLIKGMVTSLIEVAKR